MSLVLYGLPLSQPVRAVAWLLLMKGQKFEFSVIVPGQRDIPIGSRHPNYLQKVPTGQVPALADGDFVVSESNAILSYLCDKFGWGDFYPQNHQQRAKVNEVMHWYHRTIREVTIRHFMPRMRPDLRAHYGDRERATSDRIIKSTLEALEKRYLATNAFVAGDRPTIADITAYSEIAQLHETGLFDFSKAHPKIAAWLGRMRALPQHDVAFASLHALGKLTPGNEEVWDPATLKNSTVAGLKALKTAVAKL